MLFEVEVVGLGGTAKAFCLTGSAALDASSRDKRESAGACSAVGLNDNGADGIADVSAGLVGANADEGKIGACLVESAGFTVVAGVENAGNATGLSTAFGAKRLGAVVTGCPGIVKDDMLGLVCWGLSCAEGTEGVGEGANNVEVDAGWGAAGAVLRDGKRGGALEASGFAEESADPRGGAPARVAFGLLSSEGTVRDIVGITGGGAWAFSVFSFSARSFANSSSSFLRLASLTARIADASISCFSHFEYKRNCRLGVAFVLSVSPSEGIEDTLRAGELRCVSDRTWSGD